MTKWVYKFGDGQAQGSAEDRNLLGGKGANLAQMCHLKLPVPPGFTITTEVCSWYYTHEKSYPAELARQVDDALAETEKLTKRTFGDNINPLLLSVRSGARASMPGMMDTVLNLGLNDVTVQALSSQAGERFAYDSYRRFIQMYGDVVLGVEHKLFEILLDDIKYSQGYDYDTDMHAQDWMQVIAAYKQLVEEETGKPFPQNVQQQLWGAIGAVFASWMSPRAQKYRKMDNIPQNWGTAVNVQAMVFGNMGDDSATGVAFTRNPSTGENVLYGEFLVNAQGEDVVAGIRTPQNLTESARIARGAEHPSFEKLMPKVFRQFCEIANQLERHYLDMQDIEFTIERGKLWILQTRNGKRTVQAALKIAIDMVNQGLVSKEQAIARLDPALLDQLLHPTIDPSVERHILGMGLPASPGAASGEIVFSSDAAEQAAMEGRKVILVRIETSPEDIHGMDAAQGILTCRGGMTSHAAVVARGMGKPCVCGAGSLKIDYASSTLMCAGEILHQGDKITIDGATGQILKGQVAMLQPELSSDFALLMKWADEIARMKVRANCETPADARKARELGCQGIGLCRTEHMFFGPERILAMREMILAASEAERRLALNKLLPMQRSDFVELFTTMDGLPVTIRLLDPPLHEFLPKTASEIAEVASALKIESHLLQDRAHALHEFNPMLGLRGCRLGVTYPEIFEMQARAIFEATVQVQTTNNITVIPEIMVPLVAMKSELDFVKNRIDEMALDVMNETGIKFTYQVGTMIELPRAALMADEISEQAEFFSFGTNDLTQTTFGISRDDAGPYLTTYLHNKLIEQDPFVSLDAKGVGALVQIAAEKGRKTRPQLKLGICGEHGGDPASIAFCEQVGLDYVSCSPFRVPIARLASAQAVLKKHTTIKKGD